jgi:hypothetical protein
VSDLPPVSSDQISTVSAAVQYARARRVLSLFAPTRATAYKAGERCAEK